MRILHKLRHYKNDIIKFFLHCINLWQNYVEQQHVKIYNILINKLRPKQALQIANSGEIRITVRSEFDPTRTDKKENKFVWLYNVKIENLSNLNIKITGGRFEIFDQYGKTNVKDESLSSSQPVLKAEEAIDFTSLVRLFSDSGLMHGKYFIVDIDSNKEFYIDIPTISLDSQINKEKWN